MLLSTIVSTVYAVHWHMCYLHALLFVVHYFLVVHSFSIISLCIPLMAISCHILLKNALTGLMYEAPVGYTAYRSHMFAYGLLVEWFHSLFWFCSRNMALLINDVWARYYHMDDLKAIQYGQRFLISFVCLVVKAKMHGILIYLNNIVLSKWLSLFGYVIYFTKTYLFFLSYENGGYR